MESGYGVKRQAENSPSTIDDEGGQTINVTSNGNGGVSLTDSVSGNDESEFTLRNSTTPPESVTYECSSQGFKLQFSATPAPVTLNGIGSSCGAGCFQAAQPGGSGSWKLVLQANTANGAGSRTPPGKSYSYTVTLLDTGESHDPTMDIEC